ncbi:MAG: cytochrome P450 [Candidatus Binatia bacterium]
MDFSPPLHDPHFHAGDPLPDYRRLRAEAPIHWHPTPGFWVLSRHEDVVAVSRDPATFCSGRGVLLSDIDRPIMRRQSIIYMDPPEHAKYRKLVQPAFSPGRLRALEATIEATSRTLLAGLDGDGPVDFVDAYAAPLPMLVIADMLGVPGEDRAAFKRWSDAVIEAGSTPTAENMAQSVELLEYFGRVIAERRAAPADDIISVLVHSEIDGERLEEFDLLMFCMTLLVAGNETTRNLLSHGALALATHPEERALLAGDAALMPRAIEEMLRWGSPISSFMRVATRDTELRGTPIREGERLYLLYTSANRDEAVFGDDAEAFRISRDAARHVAFGFGEHFCLGAQLARMEGRIAFTHLLERFARWDVAGPVERLPSLFLRGIEHLPLTFAPR